MKAKVLFFFLVLYGFSNSINADDTYITKILAMLTVFNLPERTKSQLVEKINEDVCRRVAKMSQEVDIGAEELPHFLGEVNGVEAKGFYQVYYHENEGGEVDMTSELSSLPTDKPYAGKSIGLLRLHRPINFDFSQLSDHEIIKGLRSELDKSDIDKNLKKLLTPFLAKDLWEKLRKKDGIKTFIAPYFLGGKSLYHVAYCVSGEKAHVDTRMKTIRDTNNIERSITSENLSCPLVCNYSDIFPKKYVKERVKEIMKKKYKKYPDPVYKKLVPFLVEQLQESIKEAKNSFDLPDIFGGEFQYLVDYYLVQEDTGDEPVIGSIMLGHSSEEFSITLKKLKGPSNLRFL
jgi:hypothetical protein